MNSTAAPITLPSECTSHETDLIHELYNAQSKQLIHLTVYQRHSPTVIFPNPRYYPESNSLYLVAIAPGTRIHSAVVRTHVLGLGSTHRGESVLCSCSTDTVRSDSVNSWGVFHPISPKLMRSWTMAWKSPKPSSRRWQDVGILGVMQWAIALYARCSFA